MNEPKHRYRIEIDYESPTEWCVGAPADHVGESASTEEIATILEVVSRLLRVEFPNGNDLCVRHPARSQEKVKQ